MDAFLLYLNLLVPILHRVVLKIKYGHAHIILTLAWLYQHWFSMLLTLSTRASLTLSPDLDLISQNHRYLVQLYPEILHLIAWMLHGEHFSRRSVQGMCKMPS